MSVFDDRFAETHQRLPEGLGRDKRMEYTRSRMEGRRRLGLLDVNGAGGKVDVLDPPNLVPSSPKTLSPERASRSCAGNR